jgi:hypothetical protein
MLLSGLMRGTSCVFETDCRWPEEEEEDEEEEKEEVVIDGEIIVLDP